MPGQGKSPKTYVINIAEEESAFKTEGTTQRAIGGPIQEQPSLKIKSDILKVSKHNELGANHKIEKGGTAHDFKLSYAVESWKALYYLLGGIIEQVHLITVADSTGFDANDEVSIGSDIIGVVNGTPTSTVITMKKFTKDEAITISGGASATIGRYKNNKMYIDGLSGTPSATGTITGDTSGAKISYSAYSSNVFTIASMPSVSDTITADSGVTTEAITALTYYHYIFAYNDPPSFSMPYNYESLTNQHLLLGCVCNDINIKGAGNDIPKINENWLVSKVSSDATKDTIVNNSTTDLYKYENLTLLINSNDLSALVKSRDITLKRDLSRLFTSSLEPSGIRGPTLESVIKLGIYREDYTLYDLRVNDTNFPVVFTWTRSSHSCAITFSKCKALDFDEGENDKSVFIDFSIEVEGTPTAVVIDDIANYGL